MMLVEFKAVTVRDCKAILTGSGQERYKVGKKSCMY